MPASHPAAFLSGESRQVWALRRDTGEPVYLEVGQAAALRAFAKTNLRCPYPGCLAPISTRGGSKRDHFFHLNTAPHETGRESEFHLAAKAMLAQWLAGRMPEGATVQEEQTVKDPKTAVHRRPDVLATGRTGRKVAYEIEYKSWAIAGWEHKQADLDALGIVCLWLFGHTRVRLAANAGHGANHVVVPELVANIARRRLPVLLVNPVTREIGTLTNSHGDKFFAGASTSAFLHVTPLDSCSFSSIFGLRTPTMLLIEEAERKRAAVERARAGLRNEWAAIWERSALHARFVERWGSVPGEFAARMGVGQDEAWRGRTPAFAAATAHWRAVIYEDLVHQRKEPFRWREVFAALKNQGIEVETGLAGGELYGWMHYLARLRLLEMKDRKRRYATLPVWEFTPTGRALGEVRDAWLDAQRSAGARGSSKEAERVRRAADLEARSRTKMIVLEDGSKRWVPK